MLDSTIVAGPSQPNYSLLAQVMQNSAFCHQWWGEKKKSYCFSSVPHCAKNPLPEDLHRQTDLNYSSGD